MEPTPDEMSAMRTVADIAAWLPMEQSTLESLADLLGFNTADPWRACAFMDTSWYQGLLVEWT
eukprot:5328725-Amphidinium_carterae.1